MSRIGIWITVAALLQVASGCSRSPLLVSGPIEAAQSPTVVRFDQPMESSGTAWELCFEFDRPKDSDKAGGIRAVLLTADGQRHPLVETTLDRRGETLVCQMGRVAPIESGPEGSAQETSVVYEAVELTSPTRLRIRAIRGGNRL